MTPKEKAKELVDKFKNPVKPDESYSDYNFNYIACALIAVDEILNINSVDKDYELSNFWQEVKSEIENL